ncbi:hypothetical protein RUM43_009823 [Polyplax serrata]|uniref:Uncharacterized protein n=1 Tax=Polyplax serrata TaxID=468196 RepID=A0AAN8P7M4_POLSC
MAWQLRVTTLGPSLTRRRRQHETPEPRSEHLAVELEPHTVQASDFTIASWLARVLVCGEEFLHGIET